MGDCTDYIDFFWLILGGKAIIFAEKEETIREFVAQEMDIMKRNYKSPLPFLADLLEIDKRQGEDTISFYLSMPGMKAWCVFRKEKEVKIQEEAGGEQTD